MNITDIVATTEAATIFIISLTINLILNFPIYLITSLDNIGITHKIANDEAKASVVIFP